MGPLTVPYFNQGMALAVNLAAAGLAVGLVLKDSLANFAAGVMLIFFRPWTATATATATADAFAVRCDLLEKVKNGL